MKPQPKTKEGLAFELGELRRLIAFYQLMQTCFEGWPESPTKTNCLRQNASVIADLEGKERVLEANLKHFRSL